MYTNSRDRWYLRLKPRKIQRIWLAAFPPVWRYWPLYILSVLAIGGLIWAWYNYLSLEPPGTGSTSSGNALLAGVTVAVAALIANTWSQWQTSRIANAITGLQTLRTDAEYLDHSNLVYRTVSHDPHSNWGEPLRDTLADKFKEALPEPGKKESNFREASLFILNQYEFLASATRSGAVDIVLMDSTMRGPIAAIVTTYSREIHAFRKKNDRVFTDLIWLYETLTGTRFVDLGTEVGNHRYNFDHCEDH